MGCGHKKKTTDCCKTECRARTRGFKRAASFHEALAADTDGAETQDDMTSGSGPAEAHHWAEAREKKHLVKLMAQIGAVGTRENLVAGHLAVRVDSDVDEKTVRKRKLHLMLLGGPRLRIIRQRQKLGGTQNIERHVVGNGTHGDARHHQLQHENKHYDRGKNTAGGGNGERTKNIVEKNFATIAYLAQTARPIMRMLRLSCCYFNAHSQIGRGNIFRHPGKQDGKLAEGFQLGTANGATAQMLANLYALRRRRGAGDGIVEIARQFCPYRGALHESPSPAVLARRELRSSCEESFTRRAAEYASPKGDGCGSTTEPCALPCGVPLGAAACEEVSGSCSRSSGSSTCRRARRPRRMRDFTVPTLHSRTSATSS